MNFEQYIDRINQISHLLGIPAVAKAGISQRTKEYASA